MSYPSPSRIVSHPLTVVSAVLTAVTWVFQVPGLDVVAGVVWSNAGALFAALSVIATQIAPNFGFIPTEPLQIAALLAAIVFAATRLEKFGSALLSKWRNR